MKTCPSCNRNYADDSLRFCLEDGSTLSPPFEPGGRSLGTAQTEVLISPSPTQPYSIPVAPTQASANIPFAPAPAHPVSPSPAGDRPRSRALAATILVSVTLILFVSSFVYWMTLGRTNNVKPTDAPVAGLEGYWAGTANAGESKPWTVQITFRGHYADVDYPSRNCSATWEVISNNFNSAKFRESMIVGFDHCPSGSIVEVTKIKTGLTLEWRLGETKPVMASGTATTR
jgi:hypothetical protein